MSLPAEFGRLYVVLVGARNPLNIGAAARAMSNFGFLRLRVVKPYHAAFREARSAVGASALLATAEEYVRRRWLALKPIPLDAREHRSRTTNGRPPFTAIEDRLLDNLISFDEGRFFFDSQVAGELISGGRGRMRHFTATLRTPPWPA